MKRKKVNKTNNKTLYIWLVIFIIIFFISIIFYVISLKENKTSNKNEVVSEETVRFKLNGEKTITIYTGSNFKEPGFVAESSINGDISSYVKIDGEVNTKKPNTYKITYTLDYKGVTPTRTRKVIVKDKNDTTVSKENDELVLTLNGSQNISILKGSEYKEKGAKAVDNKGKDISKKIKITGNVNTNIAGTYKVTYSIINSKNSSLELTRLVTVSDMSATITPNIQTATNSTITLNIAVKADKFSHIKLPNGQIVTTNNYNYQVGKNGKYSFEIYNTDKLAKKYTYEVKNIDKERPTGSCEVTQNAKETFITINAKDNVGIKNYVYNNNVYTTNKITTSETVTKAVVTIYDEANNQTQITCQSKNPIISKLTKDGVIITVESKKTSADIAGYYFSYNNQLPDKNSGGYIATNKEKIDLVRLAGTTYVWVEDKNGMISSPKTISIDNSALLLTRESKYKILQKTTLEDYLKNKGWSIEELNKLIIRSVRAAGLYSPEAAATSAVALQTVLAQKYNLKLPY